MHFAHAQMSSDFFMNYMIQPGMHHTLFSFFFTSIIIIGAALLSMYVVFYKGLGDGSLPQGISSFSNE